MERRGGASGDVCLLRRGRWDRGIVFAAAYLEVQFLFENTAAECQNNISQRLPVNCHLPANSSSKHY